MWGLGRAAQVVFQPQKDEKAQMQDAVRREVAFVQAGQGAKGEEEEGRKEQVAKKPYQFLLVSRLREYLALEFRLEGTPFPIDVERVYDDFGAGGLPPHNTLQQHTSVKALCPSRVFVRVAMQQPWRGFAGLRIRPEQLLDHGELELPLHA
jgi:hypothetical protein